MLLPTSCRGNEEQATGERYGAQRDDDQRGRRRRHGGQSQVLLEQSTGQRTGHDADLKCGDMEARGTVRARLVM